jgi:hypothetical protein
VIAKPPLPLAEVDALIGSVVLENATLRELLRQQRVRRVAVRATRAAVVRGVVR